MPRVSIGLPVYNGEHYVAQALDAILAQTFTDFEVIIVDNASTDRTRAIGESYCARDARLRYYRNEANIGAAPNFNRAFALATGAYFKWCAHDDLITSDYLARCVEVLDREPAVALCCSQVQIIDENSQVVGAYIVRLPALAATEPHRRFGVFIRFSPACFQVFGLFRASVLAQTSLIGSHLGSDKTLIAETCLRGQIYEIPEPLFFSRQHPQRSVKLARQRLAGWFDAANEGRRLLPHWQKLSEYARVVGRAPLSAHERWSCYLQLPLWVLANKHWARLLFDPIMAVAPGLWDALWRLGQRFSRPRGYFPRYFRYFDQE